MNKRVSPESPALPIDLRPIGEDDMEFLFLAYASTRQEEKALFAWPDAQWEAFLRMQFELQHTQYMRNYRNPSFDIVLCAGESAGRLYVDRSKSEIRIIDIIVMPEFRRQGLARQLIAGLIGESDAARVPLSLHVENDNPIMAYYKRMGFRICADRGVYQYMERDPAIPLQPRRIDEYVQ